jgi:hypothetical protein
MAANRHICSTCGFNIPSASVSNARAVNDQLGAKPQAEKSNFWGKLFGNADNRNDAPDSGTEEPAMG